MFLERIGIRHSTPSRRSDLREHGRRSQRRRVHAGGPWGLDGDRRPGFTYVNNRIPDDFLHGRFARARLNRSLKYRNYYRSWVSDEIIT